MEDYISSHPKLSKKAISDHPKKEITRNDDSSPKKSRLKAKTEKLNYNNFSIQQEAYKRNSQLNVNAALESLKLESQKDLLENDSSNSW